MEPDLPKGNGKVVIHTSHGDIEIILNPRKAPVQCSYFMDWVASMVNTDDPPCCFQRVVKNFYIQFNLHDGFKEEHSPTRLPGMKFDKPGFCAFSNISTDQFVITLDPCDALNHKYSIFGEVSPLSMDTLKRINKLEGEDDGIPDELQIISSIEVAELIDNSLTTPSAPPTPIMSHDSSTLTEPPLVPPPSLNTSFTSLTRSASSVFLETTGTPKRQKLDNGKPQAMTPIPRTSTFMLDQQQCFMSSHFASAIGGDLGRPTIARSFSAPDTRLKFQPKWPKRLVIVRHGQSEQNACLDLYQDDIDALLAQASIRDCDIKLTEFGKWQAEQTGKYFAGSDQFDICFSSPYHRAINTAELIAKELPYKLKIYKDNWLREKEFGRLHGLNEKTVKERFPLEYEIRNRDGRYWYRFPGGENYCDVEMRVHCFLEKLSRDYAGRSVLVVTHQVPYKLFRALFQHLDEEGVLNLEAVHNCGIQEYLLDRTKSMGGRMKLKMFNHASYNPLECPPYLIKNTKSTE